MPRLRRGAVAVGAEDRRQDDHGDSAVVNGFAVDSTATPGRCVAQGSACAQKSAARRAANRGNGRADAAGRLDKEDNESSWESEAVDYESDGADENDNLDFGVFSDSDESDAGAETTAGLAPNLLTSAALRAMDPAQRAIFTGEAG
jgi:hypothetical protein